MSLSDRDRKILLVLAPLLIAGAYWFLLLAPKREEAATAADELTKQEQRRDTARSSRDQARAAKGDFREDYSEVVRLGKAIPAQLDMPSLMVQLDRASDGTGIRFTKIATGEREGAPATPVTSAGSGSGSQPGAAAGGQPAQSAPGKAVETANNTAQAAGDRNAAAEQSGVDAQTSVSAKNGGLPVGGGAANGAGANAGGASTPGLETAPLQLEFVGNFFNLADFFHRIKRFVEVANRDVLVSGRLITIESVKYSSDPEIFPRMRAELQATIYLSPKAEGTTAGATPQGPAPASPPATGTPASGGGSTTAPATPTAAATP